jgi:hypothetical protein
LQNARYLGSRTSRDDGHTLCKKESDDSEQFKEESQLQLSQTPVSGMTW